MSAFDEGLWARLVDEYHADEITLRPPVHKSRRPLVAGLGGLAAAAVAGALAAMLSLTGGAGDAFAGWTAQPTAPSTAQLTAADTYCSNNIPDPGLPLQLSDTRGPFTIRVYSNGGTSDFCTVGPSFQNASGWSTSPPIAPPSDRLIPLTDHTTASDGHAYGIMIARAGEQVKAANLTLSDGTPVTATVQNGWALAWWPGADHPTTAQLATPTGIQTQTFPAYPCDVHNCHGRQHGGASYGGSGG